ncbi:zinc ribbon domain-containing protein [bacterium]|nr:zinc ribbon domain-containing protein [bacterium]
MTPCAQCGANNAGDDKFCPHCGASLQAPTVQTGVEPRSLQWIPVFLLLGAVILGVSGLLASKLFALARDRQSASPTATPTVPAKDYSNPWPSSETIPTSTPTASPSDEATAAPDMQAQLDEYYRLIDAKLLNRAYALRSQRSRTKTSLAEFEKIWGNNRSISMEDFQILNQTPDKAGVQIKLRAEDLNENTGKTTVTMYQGKVTLVLEENLWRYDGGDFQAED